MKIAYCVSFCSLLASLSSCGTNESSSKPNIFGGVSVGANDPVSQTTADISSSRNNSWFQCTGTLISETHVLTAAHCIYDAPNTVLVTVQNQDRRAIRLISHKRFDRRLLNSPFPSSPPYDIAVIRVAGSFRGNAKPARYSRTSVNSGESIVVAGFGENERAESSVLRKMHTTVASANHLTKEIASHASQTRVGNGDSGGPAYVMRGLEPIVAGVISRTIGWRRLDVYTDVSQHADWIDCILRHPENELAKCADVNVTSVRFNAR